MRNLSLITLLIICVFSDGHHRHSHYHKKTHYHKHQHVHNKKNKDGVINMNGNYIIANPDLLSKNQFNTNYSTYKTAEYFDVYSHPIKSRYGEVFWTMMEPVDLPDEIVKRFANKTMVIVGYETDQVQKTDKGDVSWPIYYAYNHHYEAWLTGSSSTMRKIDTPEGYSDDNNHGYSEKWVIISTDDDFPEDNTPTSTWFSEGNGGEFRKSFHGYPHGFGQFIYSPNQFRLQPMQIDTHNRNYDGPGFKADLLPKTSAAPPNATYSGLLECPCTDRRNIVYGPTYNTQNSGTCQQQVQNSTQCYIAARNSVGLNPKHIIKNTTVNSDTYPTGCFVINEKNDLTVYWNEKSDSKKTCGEGAVHYSGTSQDLISIEINVNVTTQIATISMNGPSNVWFGLGLGATEMTGAYAIVVDGKGSVWEQKLGSHAPGTTLKSMITVQKNTVSSGNRTVIVTRPFKGLTSDYYTFNPSTNTEIDYIDAVGNTVTYSHHKVAGGSTIKLVASDASTCICYKGITGTIDGVGFSKNCVPFPNGDLLSQKNPTCFIETYQGGLSCCRHQNVLLDKDQIQPEPVDTYYLKWRFWYQEYNPSYHQNLPRLYWQTEAHAGEYDIPKCDPTTPVDECVHEITAHWKVSDMIKPCSVRDDPGCTGEIDTEVHQGVHLIYAGGHCHAPSCISIELYNADTGKLLCRQTPVFGTSVDEIYNEKGYLALPPCLWGPNSEGLMEPELLKFDTNLMSIKRNNSTNAHYGEMASWQMRGVVV